MNNDHLASVQTPFADRLAGLADALRAEYWAATPWPHVCIDGLFPDDLLERALAELCELDAEVMHHSAERRHVKRELHDVELVGPATGAVLELMESEPFLAFVRDLTGVSDLSADPRHVGAGVHETPPGGFTMIHLDFPAHPFTRLHHRVNALLYLNREWRDEWGGQLELWPSDMTALGRRISPSFNRLVVFGTDALTRHGLPEPVACPEGMSRLSLASYYYSKDPAPHRLTRRATYRARPQDPRWISLPKFRDLVHLTVPAPARLRAKRLVWRLRGRHYG